MSKGYEALVEPELLVWARQNAGVSVEDAARRVQVPVAKLEDWELGTFRPTINQLRALAATYKRSLTFFYLPAPPSVPGRPHDYRLLFGGAAHDESPALLYEIRRAHDRRDIALELYESVKDEPPTFTESTTLGSDTEAVGEQVRNFLGVPHSEQVRWRDSSIAFNRWRAAFERVGVLVFQAVGVEVTEMRGFSIGGDRLPVAVVNRKDSYNGRNFTLFHELAHLMLHREGLCDIKDEAPVPSEDRQVEIFCNHVAGAALVPRHQLLADTVVMRKGDNPVWMDAEIESVARNFCVSMEVVLRRLLILGRTTQAFYEAKRAEYAEEYGKRRKSVKSGFLPPDTDALSAGGKAYVRLVLRAYREEAIGARDASDFLAVRTKWFDKLEIKALGDLHGD